MPSIIHTILYSSVLSVYPVLFIYLFRCLHFIYLFLTVVVIFFPYSFVLSWQCLSFCPVCQTPRLWLQNCAKAFSCIDGLHAEIYSGGIEFARGEAASKDDRHLVSTCFYCHILSLCVPSGVQTAQYSIVMVLNFDSLLRSVD